MVATKTSPESKSQTNLDMTGTDEEIRAWLDLTQQVAQQLDEKTHLVDTFWKHDLRSDGRIFSETRPYTITHNVIPPAAGSALVQVEGTVVLAAVTIAVGQCVAAQMGDCVVHVVPSSNTQQQQQQHSELQSLLQRLLDENLDFPSLHRSDSNWALRLQVQVQMVAWDGSGVDVAVAAVSAALLDTTVPTVLDPVQGTVEASPTAPLVLPIVPCAVSAVEWSGDDSSKEGTTTTIVDPTAVEESAGTGVATVIVNALDPTMILAVLGPVRPVLMDWAANHAEQLYTTLLRPPSDEKKK